MESVVPIQQSGSWIEDKGRTVSMAFPNRHAAQFDRHALVKRSINLLFFYWMYGQCVLTIKN